MFLISTAGADPQPLRRRIYRTLWAAVNELTIPQPAIDQPRADHMTSRQRRTTHVAVVDGTIGKAAVLADAHFNPGVPYLALALNLRGLQTALDQLRALYGALSDGCAGHFAFGHPAPVDEWHLLGHIRRVRDGAVRHDAPILDDWE